MIGQLAVVGVVAGVVRLIAWRIRRWRRRGYMSDAWRDAHAPVIAWKNGRWDRDY